MGTNYYWYEESLLSCLSCKRPFEQQKLHIGKSSYGWCFALHVIPELGINDLINWVQLFAKSNSFIINENKQLISAADMIEIITCGGVKKSIDVIYAADTGPNNLMRHKIDCRDCIGHRGTWDLITGDFS